MSGEELLKSALTSRELDKNLTKEQLEKRYLFDFVVFGQARSGTHLIASLLNSHPDIACEGEVPVTGYRDPDRGYSTVSWPVIQASAGCLPPKGRIRGCICHYINQYVFVGLQGYRPKLWVHLIRNPADNARSLIRRWNLLRMTDGAAPPHYFDKKDIPLPEEIDEDSASFQHTLQETKMIVEKNIEFLYKMQAAGEIRFMNLSYDDLTEGKNVTEIQNIHTVNLLRFLGMDDEFVPLRAKIVRQSEKD